MKIGVFFIFALVVCTSVVQTLKCQTDEGITEEEARKMVKKCIRKMSDDFDGKNYREYDSYDSNEDGGEQYKKPSYNSWNNKNNRIQQPGNYDMRTGNHESRGGHYGSNYARLKRQEYLNQNDHHGYNNNQRSGHNNQGNTSSDNERSCLFQCFFHELRAINNDGFPDKHKVLQALTRDIRDHELKDFYTDSIQECFHMIDLEQRREKCQYSKNLITCLTERAKTNCNDWDGSSLIF